MKTEIVSIHDPSAIPFAMDLIHHGQAIAFPTDTVYGLATALDNVPAISRLYEIKGRDFAKAIPVLIGDISQIQQISPGLSKLAQRLAEKYWPGALTLIIARHPHLPATLSSTSTVGVRMPDFDFTRRLLLKTGPLAVTSANLSGGKNSLTTEDVLDQLNTRIPLILDGGKTGGEIPSTVVDCTKDPVIILRHGAIEDSDIFKVLD